MQYKGYCERGVLGFLGGIRTIRALGRQNLRVVRV